jgi:hypothetical protein
MNAVGYGIWGNGNYFGGQYPRPSHQFLLPARDNQGHPHFILTHTAPQSGLYGDGEYLPDEQFSQYILDDPEGTEHDEGDNGRRFINHEPMPNNPIAPAADAGFGESFGFGVAPFLDVWSSNFNGGAQNFHQTDHNFMNYIIPGQNLNGQRPLAMSTHSMHGQYGLDDGDQQSEGSYKKMRAPGQPTNIVPTPKMDRKTLKRLRNRVSASRCRIKKKVWIQDMETKANVLEQQRLHYLTRLNKLQEAIQYCHQALSMQGNPMSCPGSPISSQWSVSSHHHAEIQHPTKRGPVSAAASSLMLMGLESSQKRHSLMEEGDDKGLSSIDVSHFLTTNPAPSVTHKKIQQQ